MNHSIQRIAYLSILTSSDRILTLLFNQDPLELEICLQQSNIQKFLFLLFNLEILQCLKDQLRIKIQLWSENYISIYVVWRMCHKLPFRKMYKAGYGQVIYPLVQRSAESALHCSCASLFYTQVVKPESQLIRRPAFILQTNIFQQYC